MNIIEWAKAIFNTKSSYNDDNRTSVIEISDVVNNNTYHLDEE